MVRQHSRRVSDRLPRIPNNGILKPFHLKPEKMTYLRVVSPKSSQYLPFLGLVQSNFVRRFNSPAQEPVGKPSSQKVSAIVDEISGLTLLEVADLTELLRKKLGVSQMPLVSVMMPGMGFSLRGMGKGGGGAAAAVAEEKKEEKTAFDLKLEAGFEAASKIKIIKEVRSFTDLGLKEAKDLVEKAPTVLKKGVSKEDAEKIIEKMKAIGAKVIME